MSDATRGDNMQIYVFRRDVFTGPPIDLTGFEVEATDGHLGRIDEATYQNGMGCLVVDTGFWIFGKKRMLPAGVVTGVDAEERKVSVALTKDEVKEAPDYDAQRHRDDEDRYHDEVGGYYDREYERNDTTG
jgi:hypothetical protein